MRSTRPKLASLLKEYRFGTVAEVMKLYPPTTRLTLRQAADSLSPVVMQS